MRKRRKKMMPSLMLLALAGGVGVAAWMATRGGTMSGAYYRTAQVERAALASAYDYRPAPLEGPGEYDLIVPSS